ncbi:MAG TPA: VIT domain-containing protein [Spirochaetota bacterium]|nr:VIT domain-containing protein [Spirochaetota bacterium]
MKRLLFIFLFIFTTFFGLFSDGFVVIVNPPERTTPFILEVKNHNVDVKINELIAETNIDQTFYNPSKRSLEGTYLFPVPKGAVIKKFSMFINGVEAKAELLDATKARKIYEDIVRQQLDPAILEYDGFDVFKVRIFPIEANSEKRVKISYTEILNKDMGTVEYVYPLNTEKFSSAPLKNLTINVRLESNDEIKSVYSTTHKAEIIRKNKNLVLTSYEETNTKPDIDFKLYFNTENSKMGFSLLTYKEKNEEGYFYLNITPSIDFNSGDIEEKDVTFVFDSSGSMSGKNLIQAKKALKFCVDNLNEKDRFEIIRFSTEAEPLFGKLTEVNKSNVDKAEKFIEKIEAIGGTNIDEALKMALSNKKDNSQRLHLVIFITDGKPTIGETDENMLLKSIEKVNSEKTRIFTFGIGYEINTHLLDKLTDMTKAYRSYILPDEDIEVKISNFFIKVKSPILTDLKLSFNGNIKTSKIYPKELPDLFRGSSLNLLGIYEGSGDVEIILDGKAGKKNHQFKSKFNFSNEKTKDDFVPLLWATRRVGHLLDIIRLNKEEKEIIDEIVYLARKYGIVTPYTSFLILEDEMTRGGNNRINDDFRIFNKADEKEVQAETKKSYDKMKKEKSGKDSISASQEFQNLNMADNVLEQRKQNYSNSSKSQSLQYKNIQNRAFYQNDKYWIDSKIDTEKNKNLKTVRIQFASQKYFEILNKNKEMSQYLSLGKNIRFLYNGEVYEIYE